MKNIKSLITTCNMTAVQLQKYIKSAEFFQKSLEMTNNHCLTRFESLRNGAWKVCIGSKCNGICQTGCNYYASIAT